MAEYLLAVHMVDGAEPPSPEAMEEAFRDVDTLNAEMQAAGVWVFAGGLQPADTATVVRVDDGQLSMTDGPFAETKEHLGGFWVIECPDLDVALDWASRATRACKAPVEVRPFQVEPQD